MNFSCHKSFTRTNKTKHDLQPSAPSPMSLFLKAFNLNCIQFRNPLPGHSSNQGLDPDPVDPDPIRIWFKKLDTDPDPDPKFENIKILGSAPDPKI